MKTHIIPAVILALSLPAVGADPKREVLDAIKKLSEQPSYSWTSTPKTEGSGAASRQGPIEGKTEKGGVTCLKGSSREDAYEVAFKGEKSALKFRDDWITPDELEEGGERVVRRLKALKKPVEEAEELVNKTAEIKKESDGVYAGDLSAEGAKELFGRLGRRAAEAPEAKGSVKFWVKDGQLTKYEFGVQGKITVGEAKREVNINRTVTVEIKDIGSTKVALPEAAAKKLS